MSNDRPTMRPRGYTWLDCVKRIEPELLAACLTFALKYALRSCRSQSHART